MNRLKLEKDILLTQGTLQALEQRPFLNRKKIQATKMELVRLQALEEGAISALTPAVTNRARSTSKDIDKNNYATYPAQVKGTYEMYEGRASYGGELMRGIVDIRTAFIGGEGLSVSVLKNKAREERKYVNPLNAENAINTFISENKLHGSRLIRAIEMGEKEGKALLTLKSKNVGSKKKIQARCFSWYRNKYTIESESGDFEDYSKITYTVKDKEKEIPVREAVFVRLGGAEDNINNTPNRIHVVLTDIENISRAKYDLRKNTHVFGKYIPYWKTPDLESARAINNDLAGKNFNIGDGYAGTAEFGIVEPTGAAAKAILDDILTALKCVSTSTGIPVHWLAWPELMSNRATADNIMESVIASTKKERLIWEEAFQELFYKFLVLSVDLGINDNSVLVDLEQIQVKLPEVSIALLKQLIEVYLPLRDADVISNATVQNKTPGIDPAFENKQIKKEKEERAKDSPFMNGTVNDKLGGLQKPAEGADDEDDTGENTSK